MPVISTRRLTTTGSSSYLPPSVGGTTSNYSSSLSKPSVSSSLGSSSGFGTSTYRSGSYSSYSGSSYSSSGSLSRTPSYRYSLYGTTGSTYGSSYGLPSSYRTSYLTSGHNDSAAATASATNRFGVSKSTRSSCDRDTTPIRSGRSTLLQPNDTTKSLYTKKPPIGISGGNLSSSASSLTSSLRRRGTESRSRDNSTTRYHTSNTDPLFVVGTSKSDLNNINNNNSNSDNNNQDQTQSKTTDKLYTSSKLNNINNTNNNSNNNNTIKRSSSSSSSFAKQVATSGLDLYEKYSPAHYIPKCELSRSRSLSEATTAKLNSNSNDSNDLSNSSSNVPKLLQRRELKQQQQLQQHPLSKKDDSDTETDNIINKSSASTTVTISKDRNSPTQLANKVKKELCSFPTTISINTTATTTTTNLTTVAANDRIPLHSNIIDGILIVSPVPLSKNSVIVINCNQNQSNFDELASISAAKKSVCPTIATTKNTNTNKRNDTSNNCTSFAVITNKNNKITINNTIIPQENSTILEITGSDIKNCQHEKFKHKITSDCKISTSTKTTAQQNVELVKNVANTLNKKENRQNNTKNQGETLRTREELEEEEEVKNIDEHENSQKIIIRNIANRKSLNSSNKKNLANNYKLNATSELLKRNLSQAPLSSSSPSLSFSQTNSNACRNCENLRTLTTTQKSTIANHNIHRAESLQQPQSSSRILASTSKNTAINYNKANSISKTEQQNSHSNKLRKTTAGKNTNALIQAAKFNLKSTKLFLSNKFDDKNMTNTSQSGNHNNNINNNYNNNSNNQNNPRNTQIITKEPITKISTNRNFFTNFDKNNLLDFRLDLKKGFLNNTSPNKSYKASEPIGNTWSPTIIGNFTTKSNNNISSTRNFGVQNQSTYRDKDFLRNEYELARSQLLIKGKTKSEENLSTKSNSIDRSSSNNNNNSNRYICAEKTKSTVGNNNGIRYGTCIIKPLVHRTTNSSKIITNNNNNMNCLQSSPELLDDIKFIDSDDSERHASHAGQQPHLQRQQHQNISDDLQPALLTNKQKADYLYTTRSLTNSPLTTASSSSSTLPLSSRQQRVLFLNSGASVHGSPTANATVGGGTQPQQQQQQQIKYHTLNDFKRIAPNYGHMDHSNYHYYTRSSTPPAINVSSVPVQAKLIPAVSLRSYGGSQQSHDSTPSTSPQFLRRDRNLPNSGKSNSTNVLVPQQQPSSTTTHRQDSTVNHYYPWSLSTSGMAAATSSTNTSSSETSVTHKKLSNNKHCDIDESVRNASIRSALPPSPTPSRSWDREGRSSISSRQINDSDNYPSTKSSYDSYDKNSTNTENSEGLCGLRNIGNTCFMNSVIQCLSHTRALSEFIKSNNSTRKSSKDQLILFEFTKLVREMWKCNVRSVTPSELKSAFSLKHRMYSGFNQQDAQEFLRFFLDSLHWALNTGVKGEALKIDDTLNDDKKADLTWEWNSRIENSVIRDLFVGQLKSTLKCTTCGNTSVTFDPFWDLSVPLPSSARCRLDACLDLFIREEVLDGDEMPTCSKCQLRRKCTKSLTIQRFPKYLVIHLKRFSETRWLKMTNLVEFPTGEKELNMGPYGSNSNGSTYYSLYGISNHMGSMTGGHYVAMCKHPISNKWHEFNDNEVSADYPEHDLVSASAYLLFYERA